MSAPTSYAEAAAAAEQIVHRSEQAASAAPLVPLRETADNVAKILADWRLMGSALVFSNDAELHRFYRYSIERILTQMMTALDRAVAVLVTRMGDEDTINEMSLHDVLRITEAMSTQLATIRRANADTPRDPRDVSDVTSIEALDAELQELEAEVGDAATPPGNGRG